MGHKQSTVNRPDQKETGQKDCLAGCFLAAVQIPNHWETEQCAAQVSQGGGGSTRAKRLGRPHIYDSFALNSGDSCEPKGGHSCNKLFKSISSQE